MNRRQLASLVIPWSLQLRLNTRLPESLGNHPIFARSSTVSRMKVVVTDTSKTGWGALCSSLQLMGDPCVELEHQPPRNDGSDSEFQPKLRSNHVLVSVGQQDIGCLYTLPRRSQVSSPAQTGEPSSPMGTEELCVTSRAGLLKRRSRHVVKRWTTFWEMETPTPQYGTPSVRWISLRQERTSTARYT